ncbi:MAG: hypothetical protein JF591_11250 [Lysobacter sp.]|nr:hypothetical protein [Lysobacter sp.]
MGARRCSLLARTCDVSMERNTGMTCMYTRLKSVSTIAAAAAALHAGEAAASDFTGLAYALIGMFYVCFVAIYAVAWALSTLIKSRARRMLVHAVVLGFFFAPSFSLGVFPAGVMLFVDEGRGIALLSIVVSIAVIWLVLWGMLGPAKDRLHLQDEADTHKDRNE